MHRNGPLPQVFIVIRPYSDYISYIRAGDEENGPKQLRNGRAVLRALTISVYLCIACIIILIVLYLF